MNVTLVVRVKALPTVMLKVLITGGSRGIGREIARAFARHEKNMIVSVMGRSLSKPSHPSLDGTLLETVKEIEKTGNTALAYQVNFKDTTDLHEQTKRAVSSMGGCDVVIHNASALNWNTGVKDVQLVLDVNLKSALVINNVCRPLLQDSKKASIVTMSPPIRIGRLDWLSAHPSYTVSKYGMTLAALAESSDKVRSNCLWPRYTIATSATKQIERKGVKGAFTDGRCPSTTGEAVYQLAMHDSRNAACLYDDEVVTLPKTAAPLDLLPST